MNAHTQQDSRVGRRPAGKRWSSLLGAGLAALVVVAGSWTGAGAQAAPGDSGALTAAEADGLRLMREEEKLARDVYRALGERWNLRVFDRIASSEQRHMDAVATLMSRYGVEDPAAGHPAGDFADPEFQALYTDLVNQGSESPAAALKVGGLVEEIDLVDLQSLLEQTDRADVRAVYENLSRGTRNHLRAFARQVEAQTGGEYEPQKLDVAAYAEIVADGNEGGMGEGRGRGQGRRR